MQEWEGEEGIRELLVLSAQCFLITTAWVPGMQREQMVLTEFWTLRHLRWSRETSGRNLDLS